MDQEEKKYMNTDYLFYSVLLLASVVLSSVLN